jgi:hypothetical protein
MSDDVEPRLDLFGLPVTSEARGIGRPLGSRNRSTREWIKKWLVDYGSPIEGMLQLANVPVEEVAKKYQCSLYKAAMLQQRCREEAAPYLHPRLTSIELPAPGSLTGEAVDFSFYDDTLVNVTAASEISEMKSETPQPPNLDAEDWKLDLEGAEPLMAADDRNSGSIAFDELPIEAAQAEEPEASEEPTEKVELTVDTVFAALEELARGDQVKAAELRSRLPELAIRLQAQNLSGSDPPG